MKIGINARCLEYGLSGIERYTLELAKYFSNGENIERVDLFSQRDLDIEISSKKLVNISSSQSCPSSLSKLQWESWTLANLTSKCDLDVFHAPSFILPFKKVVAGKKVITVHDLAFLKLPQCFDWKTKLYFKFLLKNSIDEADSIICISDSTRRDLEEYFPSCKDRTTVIYNGYESFPDFKDDLNLHSKLGIAPMEYWLSVGTINPRKNLHRLIEAFEVSTRGTSTKLVLVGNKDKLPPEIQNHPSVVVTGFVSDNDLANLYNNCFGFLFPSLYEGFGFPILEAMNFGKPVVCSNISSMPEVSNYADDLLVDPYSVSSISALMNELSSNHGLYKEMSTHGRNNVKRFSWEKMALSTLDCYKL
ncbi:glycosyltransferase family 1 protein [Vibrio neptunius]|uniref:glycosyltransferase family 4 protein n=1 Tax=Vibrio neptunius TaxID=170651 RepID=UPI00331494C0